MISSKSPSEATGIVDETSTSRLPDTEAVSTIPDFLTEVCRNSTGLSDHQSRTLNPSGLSSISPDDVINALILAAGTSSPIDPFLASSLLSSLVYPNNETSSGQISGAIRLSPGEYEQNVSSIESSVHKLPPQLSSLASSIAIDPVTLTDRAMLQAGLFDWSAPTTYDKPLENSFEQQQIVSVMTALLEQTKTSSSHASFSVPSPMNKVHEMKGLGLYGEITNNHINSTNSRADSSQINCTNAIREPFNSVFAKLAEGLNHCRSFTSPELRRSEAKTFSLPTELESELAVIRNTNACNPTLRISPASKNHIGTSRKASLCSASGQHGDDDLSAASFAAAVMSAIQQQQHNEYYQGGQYLHQHTDNIALLESKPNSSAYTHSHTTSHSTSFESSLLSRGSGFSHHHRGRGRPSKSTLCSSLKKHRHPSFETTTPSSETTSACSSESLLESVPWVYSSASSIDGTINDVLQRLSEAPNDFSLSLPNTSPPTQIIKRRRRRDAPIAAPPPTSQINVNIDERESRKDQASLTFNTINPSVSPQSKHDSQGNKRMKPSGHHYTESGYRLPLALGWRRETLVKGVGPSGLLGEVVYIAPCGRHLWNLDSVREYLRSKAITILTTEDFTFKSYVRLGDYYECNKESKGFVKMFELAVDDLIATALEPSTICRSSQASGSASRAVNASPFAPPLDASSYTVPSFPFVKQPTPSLGVIPPVYPSPNLELINDHLKVLDAFSFGGHLPTSTYTSSSKSQSLQTIMKNELGSAWIPWLSLRDPSSNLLQSLHNTSTNHRFLHSPDFPRLSYQQPFTSLTNRNDLEDFDKMKEFFIRLVQEQNRLEDEKKIQREAEIEKRQLKLKEERIERLIEAELRRPVEDLRLLNQKPLPCLDRIEGNKMPSEMFSHCLLTVEFLHAFTEILCIDSETIPSLGCFQSAFIDRDQVCLDAVVHLIVELLKFAILDPGIPSPRLVTQLLSQRFSEMEVNSTTVTGLLRVFLIGRNGFEDEMSDWLLPSNVTHLSELPGDKIAALLAFVCDELVCSSRLISTEIDRTIELQAALRREKFNLEAKIKKNRILLSRKFGIDQNINILDGALMGNLNNDNFNSHNHDEFIKMSNHRLSPTNSISECNSRKVCKNEFTDTRNDYTSMDTQIVDDVDLKEIQISKSESSEKEKKFKIETTGNRTGFVSSYTAAPNASATVSAAAIAATYFSEDEDEVDSADELEKRIETLNQVLEAKQRAVEECGFRLSGIYLGQDRFLRNYFVLGCVGGIFVEGQPLRGGSGSALRSSSCFSSKTSFDPVDVCELANSNIPSRDAADHNCMTTEEFDSQTDYISNFMDPDRIVAEIRARQKLAIARHYNCSSSNPNSSSKSVRKDSVTQIVRSESESKSAPRLVLSQVNHKCIAEQKEDNLEVNKTSLKSLSVSDDVSLSMIDHSQQIELIDNLKSREDQEADIGNGTLGITRDHLISKNALTSECLESYDLSDSICRYDNPKTCSLSDNEIPPNLSISKMSAVDFVPNSLCAEIIQYVSPQIEDTNGVVFDQSSPQPLDLSLKVIPSIQPDKNVSLSHHSDMLGVKHVETDINSNIFQLPFSERDVANALESLNLDDTFLTTATLLFVTQTGLIDRISIGRSLTNLFSSNDPNWHVVILFYKLQLLRAIAFEMRKVSSTDYNKILLPTNSLSKALQQLQKWLNAGDIRESPPIGSDEADEHLLLPDDEELISAVDEQLEKRRLQLAPIPIRQKDAKNTGQLCHLPPKEFTDDWWRVAGLEQLQSVLTALSPRGIRERMLIKSIQRTEGNVGPSVLVDSSSVVDLDTISTSLTNGWRPNLLRVRSRRGKGRGTNSSMSNVNSSGGYNGQFSSPLDIKHCASAANISNIPSDLTIINGTGESECSSYSIRQLPVDPRNKSPSFSSFNEVMHSKFSDEIFSKPSNQSQSSRKNVVGYCTVANASELGNSEFLEECQFLETIEALVDRVLLANLQIKGWKAPIKAIDDDSIHLIPRSTPKRSRFEQWPFDVARDRLRDLEAHLERRYLLPPLNSVSHLNLIETDTNHNVHEGIEIEGSTCSDSNSTQTQSEISDAGVSQSSRIVRNGGQLVCNSTNPALDGFSSTALSSGLSTTSSSSLQGYSPQGFPQALIEWRHNVARATSIESLRVYAKQFESAVAWDKSIMKVMCQICRRDKNEAQLLLCDGCDHGYHTYCFRPTMTSIPVGDWFCFNCLSKATGKRHCFVCGSTSTILPSSLQAPDPPNSVIVESANRLVVCYTCSRAVHPICLRPPMSRLPRRWNCFFCTTTGASGKLVSETKNQSNTSTPTLASKQNPRSDIKEETTESNDPSDETNRDVISAKRKLSTIEPSSERKRSCVRTLRTKEVPVHEKEAERKTSSISSNSRTSDNNSTSSIRPSRCRTLNSHRRASKLLSGMLSVKNHVQNKSVSGKEGDSIVLTKSYSANPQNNARLLDINAFSNSDQSILMFEADAGSLDSSEMYPQSTIANDIGNNSENFPFHYGQSMSITELEYCRRATEDLLSHESSWPFRRPVNRRTVPFYRKVIKYPMDLSTILKRIAESNIRSYSTISWLQDMRLIFKNCETFNEDDSDVGRAGHYMRKYFEEKWADIYSHIPGASISERSLVKDFNPTSAAVTSSPNVHQLVLDDSSQLLSSSAIFPIIGAFDKRSFGDDVCESPCPLDESETTQPANNSHVENCSFIFPESGFKELRSPIKDIMEYPVTTPPLTIVERNSPDYQSDLTII